MLDIRCILFQSTASPRVMWFLVPEKKCAPQNLCIMRLAKTQKIRIKSVHLQGFWSKSAYLKCFWTQFKTKYLQGLHTLRPRTYVKAML